MAEDLDEGVLYGFVGFGCVAQILKGNAERAALVRGHEAREALAGFLGPPMHGEIANLDRKLGVGREGGAGRRSDAAAGPIPAETSA